MQNTKQKNLNVISVVSIQLGFHVLKINDLKPLFLAIDLCFLPKGAWGCCGDVPVPGSRRCWSSLGHISLGDVLLCPVCFNPLSSLCCFDYSPLEQQQTRVVHFHQHKYKKGGKMAWDGAPAAQPCQRRSSLGKDETQRGLTLLTAAPGYRGFLFSCVCAVL